MGILGATTSAPSGGVEHLTGGDRGLAVAVIVGFVLVAGLVVIAGRYWLEGPKTRATSKAPPDGTAAGRAGTTRDTPDATLVRSWLAISLVGGLLIFVVLSFWLDDTTLRSTLVGGLVANAGAAVAFYFASKSSDQARKDILAAALPSALVPSLIGKDLQAAHAAVASTPLRLEVHPATPGTGAQVVTQTPAANQSTPTGSTVAATFAGPVPDLTGKTLTQAQALVTGVGLHLDPTPAAPPATTVVTSQDPKGGPGSVAPPDLTVHATFG
jgi:hypothetical protein